MPHYSFVVWTPVEIPVREKLLLLTPGSNTFNVVIDDAETLLATFRAHGAKVIQMHRLDGLEQIDPDPEIAAALGAGHRIPVLPTGGDDEPPVS